MPLTPAEEVQVARALLKCFGEDSYNCGRILKFMTTFSTGQTDLLGTVQSEALVWQPFINDGLSIQPWCDWLEVVYNSTNTT